MGLMLSILVVCVGVIEALSCYEHFQYGILHCATNIYENARRRSSVFLNYTSRRLKLRSEDSIAEDDDDQKRNTNKPFWQSNESFDEFEGTSEQKINEPECSTSHRDLEKKLDKKDKIEIVKKLLEKPSRPRAARSISMPELIHTEKDIELSKIINELAIEPIEEINVEVEEVDVETVTKEFDKLFEEIENSPNNSECVSPRRLSENIKRNTIENRKTLNEIETKEASIESTSTANDLNDFEKFIFENNKKDLKLNTAQKPAKQDELFQKMKVSQRDITPSEGVLSDSTFSQKDKDAPQANKSSSTNKDKFFKSTSLDFTKSSEVAIEPTFEKRILKKLIPDEITLLEESHPNESVASNTQIDLFEDEIPIEDPNELIDQTFDEMFNDLNDKEVDVKFKEIEEMIIGAIDNGINIVKEEDNRKTTEKITSNKIELAKEKNKEKILGMGLGKENSEEKFLKDVNNLAERIVNVCLEELKNIKVSNFNLNTQITSLEFENIQKPEASKKRNLKETLESCDENFISFEIKPVEESLIVNDNELSKTLNIDSKKSNELSEITKETVSVMDNNKQIEAQNINKELTEEKQSSLIKSNDEIQQDGKEITTSLKLKKETNVVEPKIVCSSEAINDASENEKIEIEIESLEDLLDTVKIVDSTMIESFSPVKKKEPLAETETESKDLSKLPKTVTSDEAELDVVSDEVKENSVIKSENGTELPKKLKPQEILAIKNETYLALEYKQKRKDVPSEEKQETQVIPVKWKTKTETEEQLLEDSAQVEELETQAKEQMEPKPNECKVEEVIPFKLEKESEKTPSKELQDEQHNTESMVEVAVVEKKHEEPPTDSEKVPEVVPCCPQVINTSNVESNLIPSKDIKKIDSSVNVQTTGDLVSAKDQIKNVSNEENQISVESNLVSPNETVENLKKESTESKKSKVSENLNKGEQSSSAPEAFWVSKS